ncbi:deoxyuridinetriphosphatase [Cryptosporidium sp. chipmunk genotype I]|uniref:deoxyuridinetriphosphatase n=1 Tax=Cryptosporidium sp. chipmunk genotype I TaxID=1280935 RepID=UPI00351A5AB2|nr:deoxyuridinetriphosphatase [Cryptosporidium sp. chipmunk genotype I]
MRFLILPLTVIAQQLYSNHTVSYKGDSGLDLFVVEDQIIKARETGFVRTGIKIAALTDDNEPTSCTVVGRSSISKTPLRLAVPGGVVDAGFRGELRIPLDNIKDFDFELKVGQRYFSLTGYDGKAVSISIVDKLDETERGESGLGSTGYGILNKALNNRSKTSLNPIVPLSTGKTLKSEPVESMRPLVIRSNKSSKSQTPSNSFIFPQAATVQVINIMSSEAQNLLLNIPGSKIVEKTDNARSIFVGSTEVGISSNLTTEINDILANSTEAGGK